MNCIALTYKKKIILFRCALNCLDAFLVQFVVVYALLKCPNVSCATPIRKHQFIMRLVIQAKYKTPEEKNILMHLNVGIGDPRWGCNLCLLYSWTYLDSRKNHHILANIGNFQQLSETGIKSNPLTRVSIPLHEPSEAWGGSCN